MRWSYLLVGLSLISSMAAQAQMAGAAVHSVAQYNVTWKSLGTSENDSMPLGNGDLAANVWTEQNGDVVLLVSKSDAYTETGKLVKLNRVRLHFTPQLFSPSWPFTQTLRLDRSDIEMASGDTTMRIWIDANHPAIHVELHAATPTRMTASLEMWRTPHPLKGASAEKAGMSELGSDDYPVEFEGDTLVTGLKDTVGSYHFNQQSIYPTVLRQEHLDSREVQFPDPLLHRCFGSLMSGPGLRALNSSTLASREASANLRLDVVALTQDPAVSEQSWLQGIESDAKASMPSDLSADWKAHLDWWENFWNRSWIDVSGDEQARQVSQGYAIQRYMIAASSRGGLPVKFNGGLFTVGHDMAAGTRSTATDHDPDYRAWGNSYWNQNNRLLYWPLIESGDYDLLRPWFNMYLHDLPLAEARTHTYYHHGGAFFPETMFFWGLPNLHDFGWNNPGFEIESRWQRYHIQGTLEVISQMLDYYDATGDATFARESLIPFATAILTYYDEHYPRGSDKKLVMVPAQSLETYQLVAVTPTPDLAGLKAVLPRMLALPAALTTPDQVNDWKELLASLPELPVGHATEKGKTPPMGFGDPNGMPVILPAAQYGKTGNAENPELYVAFPYHLFGVDEPNLQLALNTFKARRSPQDTCWGQDGTEAAALGMTGEARKAAVAEFTNYGDQRFRWFWKPAHDWIPDLDNGGSGMITLEEMLLQNDGRKILLTPAWPRDWTADFRLHAAFNTVVEAHVEHGKLTRVVVTPKEREKDIVITP